MTELEVCQLRNHFGRDAELIETHISWVILAREFAYKIKKPIKLSFLDYSTLEKRKTYCEKELKLNRRYSSNMYLDIIGIYNSSGMWRTGKIDQDSSPVEYAVKMKRMDPKLQMDHLLKEHRVYEPQIKALAEEVAEFHKSAETISDWNVNSIRDDFNDILRYEELFFRIDPALLSYIMPMTHFSDGFLEREKFIFTNRMNRSMIRNLHGDLHPGNIFLYSKPVIFDCIEFWDHLRHTDVLAEIGFLLMEFEYFDHSEFSEVFMDQYQKHFQVIENEDDQKLLTYYKLYRANVRAKVSAIRYEENKDSSERQRIEKYLSLGDTYLNELQGKNYHLPPALT